MSTPRRGWWESALCKGNPLFRTSRFEMQVRVCKGCPVRQDCLMAAKAEEDWSHLDGIRGGLRPADRREVFERMDGAADLHPLIRLILEHESA